MALHFFHYQDQALDPKFRRIKISDPDHRKSEDPDQNPSKIGQELCIKVKYKNHLEHLGNP